MRKTLLSLSALAVLGVWFWYSSNDAARVVDFPSAGTNIVAFGDSLVVGFGASEGNDFVSILCGRLGRPIINAGRNGDTTDTGLARLEKDVLSRDPRIVIVLLGGNDALRRVPVEDTFERLGRIIDEIHKTGAAVILVGVKGSLWMDKYEAEFRRLAKEKRVNYVPDILEGILGEPRLMADPIHPNDAGNTQMADRVEPVLRAVSGVR